MKIRKGCIIEGCNNVATKVGKYYIKLCSSHYKKKYNRSNESSITRRRKRFKKNTCEQCGWKGPCDIHREVQAKNGGRYVEGNMKSLCPNCHRLIHFTEWGLR